MVCQLVDWRFCKTKTRTEWAAAGWSARKAALPPHLEMIGVVLVVQVDSLLKDGDRISDEQVSDVLRQQLVDSYTQKPASQHRLVEILSNAPLLLVFSSIPASSSCA